MATENTIAQAWLAAASDLGIRVEASGALTDSDGVRLTYVVYLPDFGGRKGTICGTSGQPLDNPLGRAAASHGLYYSSLHESYGQYDRELFAATLNDLGWYGPGDPPNWYTGHSWTE